MSCDLNQVVRQQITVLVDDGVVVVVAVGAGEPESGHVLPRTVLFHDDGAPGY